MSAPTSSPQATAPHAAHSGAQAAAANGEMARALNAGTPQAPRELPTWQPKNAVAPSRRAELLLRVEQYARERLATLSPIYTYHCLEHTEQIVSNANVIADAEDLDPNSRVLLLIGAWMHDVGICEIYRGHEEVSRRLMREVVGSDLALDELAIVEDAIMGTKIPQQASNTVAEILCDADLLYLGTTAFSEWSERLRQEHIVMHNHNYSDAEWAEININFIRNHTYFTKFAREYCDAGCAWQLSMLENR